MNVSQADAPSKTNSKKTEIIPVVIWFTQLTGSKYNTVQALEKLTFKTSNIPFHKNEFCERKR